MVIVVWQSFVFKLLQFLNVGVVGLDAVKHYLLQGKYKGNDWSYNESCIEVQVAYIRFISHAQRVVYGPLDKVVSIDKLFLKLS